MASTSFKKGDGSRRPASGMVDLYAGWVDRYPIVLDRRRPSPRTTGRAGSCSPIDWATRCQLVGDDLFVTNVDRLSRGIEEGVANAVLVKVNQIGTLTETLECIEMAKTAGYAARSSPTGRERPRTPSSPTWRSRLGVGQIKTGSASRTDRIAKYNQLLRIAEELGDIAQYPGRDLYAL